MVDGCSRPSCDQTRTAVSSHPVATSHPRGAGVCAPLLPLICWWLPMLLKLLMEGWTTVNRCGNCLCLPLHLLRIACFCPRFHEVLTKGWRRCKAMVTNNLVVATMLLKMQVEIGGWPFIVAARAPSPPPICGAP